jgi:hypothetical protein
MIRTCKCGQHLTGYDRYLLGEDTDICVECADEASKKRVEDFLKMKPVSKKKSKRELRKERRSDERCGKFFKRRKKVITGKSEETTEG